MKVIKLILLSFAFLLMTSCWNYHEINLVAPAAGISFDYDEDKKVFILTVEIVSLKNTQSGSQMSPEYFTSEGETIFDAIRNMIAKSGRKIYWAHAKIVYISENIAKRGIIDVLDFIERDAEVRSDMKIVLVKSKRASEIFKTSTEIERIVSYHVDQALENSRSISKYPKIELWELINNIQSDISTATLPVAYIVEENGKKTAKLSGSAIFKGEKLIGFLNENDTKNSLFLSNKIYGGVIPIKNVLGTQGNVTFEIYNSQTKVKPIINDNKIKFQVSISIDVALAEISGKTDFIEEKNLEKLKVFSEERISEDIIKSFNYIKNTFDLDIFGFHKFVKIKHPDFWKENRDNFESLFKNSNIEVKVKLNIFGSATTNKIIKVGK